MVGLMSLAAAGPFLFQAEGGVMHAERHVHNYRSRIHLSGIEQVRIIPGVPDHIIVAKHIYQMTAVQCQTVSAASAPHQRTSYVAKQVDAQQFDLSQCNSLASGRAKHAAAPTRRPQGHNGRI